jgi:hypothetical protein
MPRLQKAISWGCLAEQPLLIPIGGGGNRPTPRVQIKKIALNVEARGTCELPLYFKLEIPIDMAFNIDTGEDHLYTHLSVFYLFILTDPARK